MIKKLTGLRVWLIRFLFGAALIVVYKTFDSLDNVLGGLGQLLGVLSPFFIGAIIAFFLYLPSHKIEKLISGRTRGFFARHARIFSVLAVYLAFFIIVAVALILFLPALYSNARDFLTELPGYINQAKEFIREYSRSLGDLTIVEQWLDSLTMTNIMGWLGLDNIGTYAKFAQDVVARLIDFTLGVVISVYILNDRKRILGGAKRVLSLALKNRNIERATQFLIKACHVLYSFFYGQALDALFVGVCSGVGLQIIGVPNAMVLGVVYGTLSLIPYFGAVLGIAIVAVFTFLSVGLGQFIIVMIFIVVLQQVDGNIINPKIIGKSIGIRPIWVIFGVTVGSGLFGIPGMLLGPPIMAIVQETVSDFIDSRPKKNESPPDTASEEGEGGLDGDQFNDEKSEEDEEE